MSKDNKGRYMVSFILRDRISTIVDAYDKADAIEQGHKYLENCFTSRFQITSVLRDRGREGDTQVIELTNQGILNPEDLMDLNPELKEIKGEDRDWETCL